MNSVFRLLLIVFAVSNVSASEIATLLERPIGSPGDIRAFVPPFQTFIGSLQAGGGSAQMQAGWAALDVDTKTKLINFQSSFPPGRTQADEVRRLLVRFQSVVTALPDPAEVARRQAAERAARAAQEERDSAQHIAEEARAALASVQDERDTALRKAAEEEEMRTHAEAATAQARQAVLKEGLTRYVAKRRTTAVETALAAAETERVDAQRMAEEAREALAAAEAEAERETTKVAGLEDLRVTLQRQVDELQREKADILARFAAEKNERRRAIEKILTRERRRKAEHEERIASLEKSRPKSAHESKRLLAGQASDNYTNFDAPRGTPAPAAAAARAAGSPWPDMGMFAEE